MSMITPEQQAVVDAIMDRRARLDRVVAGHLSVLDSVGANIVREIGRADEVGRVLMGFLPAELVGRWVADAYVADRRRLWGNNYFPEYQIEVAGR